ncbi:hypothetical protein G7054_g8390 [Neopestalotiopsis clavispora]|nr:hypothetical protein G7054_g8390 [Neopestalotiopsis clavispora]
MDGLWKLTEIKSPNLKHPVSVITASLGYLPNSNRFQTINLYVARSPSSEVLVGQPALSLPVSPDERLPQVQVHIHGGAWRDPDLTASSIEAAVAHTFVTDDTRENNSIKVVASINYTLSPFPRHPTKPYFNDPSMDKVTDLSRSAIHPRHVHDVLDAFSRLRSLGLSDGRYILTGHSAGACLAFQAILPHTAYWGYAGHVKPPRPIAIIGMNGLYDLPDLVNNLGPQHHDLRDVYADLLGVAFGDVDIWEMASPARFVELEVPLQVEDKLPQLIVLDQSQEDQLVPFNQTEKMENTLSHIGSLEVVRGTRCVGRHAAPWEQGYMIYQNVQDVLSEVSKVNKDT